MMANIDYINDYEVLYGSSHKCPWATINGKDIDDSTVIMEYLAKKLKIDLSKHLTKEEQAVAHAMKYA